jgi:hypothetical protein
MATKTVVANLDAWFAQISGTNYGNGKGARMSVGAGTGAFAGWTNRFAMTFPRGTLFSGIPAAASITGFKVKLRANGDCVGIGGTVKFWLERGTVVFAENAVTQDCTVISTGAADTRYPGPTRTTVNRVKYEGSPAAGDWITIDMLALGREWYGQTWDKLVLVAIAADTGTGYEEGTTSRRCTFRARETSSVSNAPYVEITYGTEQAPLTPDDPQPPAGAKYGTVTGQGFGISARYLHPEGKSGTHYQVEWYPTTATDATPGTPTQSYTVAATTAHNTVRPHLYTQLTPRVPGRWRIRFGRNGLWGPWNFMRTGTPAYQPTPVQPGVEPATLTPRIYDSISSADPADFITAVEDVWYQDPANEQAITKWASGKVAVGGAPTRVERTYSGTPLVFGTKYRWRRRIWNRDDIPSLADHRFPQQAVDVNHTPRESIGPTIVPGDTSTKLNTRTPTFVLTNPGGGNIDRYRMRFYSLSGALLHDTGEVGVTSASAINVVTPTGIWDWGQEPLVDAAIRPTGNANLGPFSDQKRVHINAAPGSPYPLSVEGAVQRADGVWVRASTVTQPVVVFPFRDTDRDLGYVESPVRREVETRTLADAHVTGSPNIATTGITDRFFLPTGLTVETVYKTRARYDDTANVRSAWSEYLFVKRSAIPTLSSVTPANAAAITDPTPAIVWTFGSAGGKAQASYRITASVDGGQIYDSGIVAGTAATHTIPAWLLPNATSVTWILQTWDTDGLAAVITRTFTTAFTVPAALTGLVATPDTDAKALVATWTVSALPATEFEAYYVYARAGNGQYERVATITDKAAPTYAYRGAGHNVETILRVTQDNGFAESAPVEVSAEIESRGIWCVRPELVMQLAHVRGGDDSGESPTEISAYPGLGRTDKLIVTGDTYGFEGQLTVKTRDKTVIDTLERYKAEGRVVILKWPDGDVRYARLEKVPRTREVVGWYTTQVSYIEVRSRAAGF